MSSNRNSRPTPSMPQRIRPNNQTNNIGNLDDNITNTHEPLRDPEVAANGIPSPPSLSHRLPEHPSSSLECESLNNEGWILPLRQLKAVRNFIAQNKAAVIPNLAILSIVCFFMLSLEESPTTPGRVHSDNIVVGVGDFSTGRGLHTNGQGYYENGLLDVSSTLFHIPAKAPTVGGGRSSTLSPTSTAIVHIVPGIPSSQQGGGAGAAGTRGYDGKQYESGVNDGSNHKTDVTAFDVRVREEDKNEGPLTHGKQTLPLNLKWSDLGYESGQPTPDPSKLPLPVSDSEGSFLNLKWSDLGYASSSPTPDPAKLLLLSSSAFLTPSKGEGISPVIVDTSESIVVKASVVVSSTPIKTDFVVKTDLENQSTNEDEENDNSSPMGQGETPGTNKSEPITLLQPSAPGVGGKDGNDLLLSEPGQDSLGFEELPTEEGNQVNLGSGNQSQDKHKEEVKVGQPSLETPTSTVQDNEDDGNQINLKLNIPAPTKQEEVLSAEEPKRNLSPPEGNPAPVEKRYTEVSSPVVDEPDFNSKQLPIPAKETVSSDGADPLLSASQSDGGSDVQPLEQLPPAPISVENPQVVTVPVDYPATSTTSAGGEGEGGMQPPLAQQQQPPPFSQMISAQPPLTSSSTGGGTNPPNVFVGWTLPIMMWQQPMHEGSLQIQRPQMPTEGYYDPQQQNMLSFSMQQQLSGPSFKGEEAHERLETVNIDNVSRKEVPTVEQNEREAKSVRPKHHNWDFNGECWSQLCVINEEKPKYGMANEDNAIYEIYYTNPPKCCGVIVEIGAGDGFTNSASHFFEHGMGWKSVLIEANPNKFEELEQNRPNAINVNAAFCEGDNTHLTYSSNDDSFHAMDGYTEVISEKHAVTPLLSSHNQNDTKLVDCIHLQQVFDNLKITHVDVMIVKVEGDPLAVVRKMEWTVRVDIWIVLLDSNPDTTGSRDQLVRTVLEGNEYVQADWDIKRWCEVEGHCLPNEVFLRKGFNPLPAKEETKRRLSEIFDGKAEQRRLMEREGEKGKVTEFRNLRGS
mmetsp:Transcript_20536/g.27023  ORF Transcript_20536/g.27023 Transcript_20536/m.27023 type:complete len:1022 (+) Transcript_20536:100-3165(+)